MGENVIQQVSLLSYKYLQNFFADRYITTYLSDSVSKTSDLFLLCRKRKLRFVHICIFITGASRTSACEGNLVTVHYRDVVSISNLVHHTCIESDENANFKDEVQLVLRQSKNKSLAKKLEK